MDDIGYTGHKFDTDIGLSYMRAQYCDPVIGRFYSNDPVGTLEHLGGTGGIHGFNRYVYANNNPYKYTDPDGEAVQFIVGAVIGTATTYNSIKDSDMSFGQKAGAMAVGTLVGGASGGIGTLINMAKGAGAVASLTTGALAGGGSEATTQLINGQEIDGADIAGAALEGAVAAVSGNVVAGVTVQGNAKSQVAQEVKEQATAIVETATAGLVQMDVDELQKD
ncbi:hypothetical protein OE749_13780 [Aestuariibacter sp. AA17]|uniref:RHS repeat-associated core domain-containing protein n=1 Tax=Fluctibacter corallii TaxID=2984329 RepID=A0ABT3AAV8_9ALTE|nr:RHS repeat-associated core domain-containing protein [Aestuariibacter sp. AA17]MCV2885763.1 hypothetical protein [Aestuariibacter sp. AA17]